MGRLGVRHAARLLEAGEAPPEEVLTKVEMIDLDNIDEFTKGSVSNTEVSEDP
jgi:hypothetical protein